MVQTDLSQLRAECGEWRQILRGYREDLQDSRKSLQPLCRNELSKKALQRIEQFDNQFHIQLINIHDLKKAIKTHEQNLTGNDAADEVFVRHELLLDAFLRLDNTLQELRSSYMQFTNMPAW